MKRIPDEYEMPFFPNDPWGGQKGEDTVSDFILKPDALVIMCKNEEGNTVLKITEDPEVIKKIKSLLEEIEESDEECRIDPQVFERDPHPMIPIDDPYYDE